MIKIEQEREERETEKRLIQERERKAHLMRMKLLLEHAFDGELQDIQQIISVDDTKFTVPFSAYFRQ